MRSKLAPLLHAVVRDLNTKIQSFPTNILAGMFGFSQRQFFETAASRPRAGCGEVLGSRCMTTNRKATSVCKSATKMSPALAAADLRGESWKFSFKDYGPAQTASVLHTMERFSITCCDE